MRLICDANIGRRIAQALASAGHDVVEGALLFRGVDDESVMRYAVAENRVLITCDRDFGDLIFGKGATPPPAILYVRFEPEDVAEIIPRLLPLILSELLQGHITVIDEDGERRRAFPGKSIDNG